MANIIVKTLIWATASCVFLNACDKINNQAQPEPNQEKIAPMPKTPKVQTYVFDGTNLVYSTLEDTLTNFTVDMKLKSANTLLESPKFSETLPEMAFNIGSIVMYNFRPNDYWLVLGEDSQLEATFGPTDAMSRITIVSKEDGVTIYHNGEDVAHSDSPFLLGKNIIVGKGYRERYWNGEMEYLDIYDDVVTPEIFTEQSPRFNSNNRIFDLGAEMATEK